MQETCRNGRCSNKLTLLVMFVAALALFCFGAPSASAQTYIVTITGGSGGGCASGNTGTLVINSATDSFEFTSSGACYFGAVAPPQAPTTQCLTNCSDLSSLPASTDITFQGDNVGACSTSATCTLSEGSANFQLQIPSGGFFQF
jgi:hypothetical protein